MSGDPIVFKLWTDAARATPVADVIRERGIRLRGSVNAAGACPDCGDGGKGNASDRFSINTRKNVWSCRQCSPKGGDVISLVMFLDGCDFNRACEALTGQPAPSGASSGPDLEKLAELERQRAARREEATAKQERYRQQERARMHGWWRSAVWPLGTPVQDYLRLRGVDLPPWSSIKYADHAQLFGEKVGAIWPLLHSGPAIYSAIIGPDNKFAGLHITWIDLSDAGGKARIADPATGELAPAKKVRGSQRGGRIELVRVDEPDTLVIGEGIETVLSVWAEWRDEGRNLARTAFWSSINLFNLGGRSADLVKHPTIKLGNGHFQKVPSGVPDMDDPGIPIPESVSNILILGDGDSDPFTTRLAVQRAAARWARAGRTIATAFAPAGMDFNDLRRAAVKARAGGEVA